MNDRQLKEIGLVSAAVVGLCAAVAAAWSRPLAAGVFAGGLWNLASLWCLAQMLRAWLGPQPSRRRVIGWLLVKFPLLYATAILLLWRAGLSPVGFGIGFTVALLVVMAGFSSALWRRAAPHA